MVLAFPLALADLANLMPIKSAQWTPALQQETSGTAAGETIVAELGPRLWEADVVLRRVLQTAARGLKARIEAAYDGKAFYLSDPTNCYPTHDPGGTILGASTVKVRSVNADNIRLSLKGLPAGYKLENDLIAIDYGSPSRRALVRMIGAVTANGDGDTSEFEVRPQLRPGIVADCAAYLAKPAAKVKIVPGSLSYDDSVVNRVLISFRVRQTLQAG